MATQNQSDQQQGSHSNYMGKKADYRIIEEIGRGTYGVVLKAQCKKTDTIVALKCILDQNDGEGFPTSALDEIRVLQFITHENIVQLIRICESSSPDLPDYEVYLVLEYCNHDLARLLKKRDQHPTPDNRKCIMKQILNGLSALHGQKVMHRDLKPANILLKNDGILKIADFGLSEIIKSPESGQQQSLSTNVVTLWYRAPELLLGDPNYGFAIDMWSVGCIFAELFTRDAILRGNSEEEQFALIKKLFGDIKWPGVHKLPLYSHLNISQFSQRQPENGVIDYRNRILDRHAVDLINKLLILNPKERIDVNKAISSNYFQPEPSLKNFKTFLSEAFMNV
ncbi:unnamed protein product [Adineta steineri]|uniref:Protein kinase domain-containing protein n=1 Tax=Adineta steineri TaxID=433720 RepID=A0A818RXH4_9BILA|nr:unnamed protein product [Adineta steineri]CAF3661267.1 unnamed protein product [Adineta steineri]